MADEIKAETAPEVETTSPITEAKVEKEEFDQSRAMALIEKLRAENKELAKRSKQVDELEAEKRKREEAELTELEKLKKTLAEAEAKAKQAEHRELMRQAADKFGLTPALAKRLQGETLEELEADAEELSKEIPAKPKTNVSATQVGEDSDARETAEQKRYRIYQGNAADVFDPKTAASMGGGVSYKEK